MGCEIQRFSAGGRSLMRRASSFHARTGSQELKITSLIDVVFLLLIFFVWTASFRIAEYVLPSQVSEAAASEAVSNVQQPPPPEADFPDIVVRVRLSEGQPTWTVNDEPAGRLADVRTKLGRVFEINRTAPVVIHPDRDVPLGHVIDLYDLARRVGFDKIQFAASQVGQVSNLPGLSK
jgi:biopolymer transport protein ExbD